MNKRDTDLLDMLPALEDGSLMYTPISICRDMVNLIPDDVFNKDAKFLDIACKSGRFLREIMYRLMESNQMQSGSAEGRDKKKYNLAIESERKEYIMREQLFGLSLNDTVVNIARRNLYGTLDSGIDNIIVLKENIRKTLKEKFGNMQFDVVVGNPPYNKDIYLDFVTFGHDLARKYDCWITPAKWQAKGGQKNEDFRKNIVPYMSKIVCYPNCSDVFLIGEQSGIAYYISDKKVYNTKEIENRSIAQTLYNNKLHREIGLTLNNAIYRIYEHIQKVQEYRAFKWVDTGTNYKYSLAINNKVNNERGVAGQYQAYGTISYATGKSNVICAPFIVEDIIESTDLTNADKVILSSDNRYVCASMQSWLNTKFVRFFIYGRLCGISPVISDITFAMVPAPEAFDHIFTDQELYEKYQLTDEEINIIESVIKERK